MKLSLKEKWIMYNQLEILKLLNPNDAKYYEEQIGVLENGCEKDCNELFSFLQGTTNEVASEVYDILDMFRILNNSYNKLSNVTDIEKDDVLFSGFDGNEEPSHYNYAKWLIEGRNLYKEFANCELNSHYNRLDYYREMLYRFNTINAKKNTQLLTLEEIKSIIR